MHQGMALNNECSMKAHGITLKKDKVPKAPRYGPKIANVWSKAPRF